MIPLVVWFSTDTPLISQESDIDQRIRTIGGLDPALTKRFFEDIQRAISAGDKAKVAHMVHYPITVTHGRRSYRITSAADFERRYAELVTPLTRQAVIEQTYDDLFVRNPGVAIGNGVIWFTALKGKSGHFNRFRILTINNPVPAP